MLSMISAVKERKPTNSFVVSNNVMNLHFDLSNDWNDRSGALNLWLEQNLQAVLLQSYH